MGRGVTSVWSHVVESHAGRKTGKPGFVPEGGRETGRAPKRGRGAVFAAEPANERCGEERECDHSRDWIAGKAEEVFCP